MDKKNSGLLHGIIMASAVIILVYSGEQINDKPDAPEVYFIKAAAASSALSLISILASFWPAIKNRKLSEIVKAWQKRCEDQYIFNGMELVEMQSTTTRSIEAAARQVAYFSCQQDYCDWYNKVFTMLSQIMLMVATALFAIGVCLL
jgi:hypothetical protein